MIYLLVAWAFLKIGLFAIGGGLVTVPFLFDLAEQYGWFNNQELTDIIAIAGSLPGPVGINMAAYAGFYAANLGGGILAPLCEALPSMLIIYIIVRLLNKWHENKYVQMVLNGIKPAVLALILFAAGAVAKEISFNAISVALFVFFISAMHFYNKNAVVYIILSACIGIVLKI
ncbi:MAG: chromate transporter [Alphaproteobacteria bacterium]|nr:chromate transporter [Alphaproteobacteria bacterium]